MEDTLNEITLYQCTRCNGIFQDLITECDCTVNADFAYRILYAYPEQQREIRFIIDSDEQVISQEIYNSLSDAVEAKPGRSWEDLSDEDFNSASLRVIACANRMAKKRESGKHADGLRAAEIAYEENTEYPYNKQALHEAICHYNAVVNGDLKLSEIEDGSADA